MSRKFSSLIVTAGFIVLTLSLISTAQPVTTGGGLSKVTMHGSGGLTGSGTTTNPAGLRRDCSSTEILKWDGDSWECSPDGGGGLSGLTTNKVPKATSSSTVGDSDIEYQPSESRYTVLKRMQVSANLGDTSTQHGAILVQSTGTGLTVNDGGVQSFHNGTYNIGGGAQAFSIYGSTTATNVAGTMINTGCSCNASGGSTNYSMWGGAGTLRNDGPSLLGDQNTFGSGPQASSGESLFHTNVTIDSGAAVSLGNTVGNFQMPTGRILLGASALTGPIQMTNAVGGGAASVISHYANTSIDANAYAGNRLFRGTSAVLRAGVNVGAGGGQFAIGDTANALVLWSYDSGGSTYGIELATGSGPDVRVRITPSGQTDVLGNMTVAENFTSGDADTDFFNSRGTLAFSGTNVTINSCGTSPSISGEAQSFQLTVGSGITSCVINLNRTFNSAPFCTFSAANAQAASDIASTGGNGDSPFVTSTTTTVTFSFAANTESSPVYNVSCMDRR